ncbi:MAG: hypothetical protein RLZZ186_906 [Cyanobacteriota bacterium]
MNRMASPTELVHRDLSSGLKLHLQLVKAPEPVQQAGPYPR